MKQNQIYIRIILDNNAKIIKKLPFCTSHASNSSIEKLYCHGITWIHSVFSPQKSLEACYFEGERKHTTQNMQRFEIRSLRFFLFVCFSLSVKVLLNVTKIKRLHNSSYQIFLETVLLCVFVELYREIRYRQIMWYLCSCFQCTSQLLLVTN